MTLQVSNGPIKSTRFTLMRNLGPILVVASDFWYLSQLVGKLVFSVICYQNCFVRNWQMLNVSSIVTINPFIGN